MPEVSSLKAFAVLFAGAMVAGLIVTLLNRPVITPIEQQLNTLAGSVR